MIFRTNGVPQIQLKQHGFTKITIFFSCWFFFLNSLHIITKYTLTLSIHMNHNFSKVFMFITCSQFWHNTISSSLPWWLLLFNHRHNFKPQKRFYINFYTQIILFDRLVDWLVVNTHLLPEWAPEISKQEKKNTFYHLWSRTSYVNDNTVNKSTYGEK